MWLLESACPFAYKYTYINVYIEISALYIDRTTKANILSESN